MSRQLPEPDGTIYGDADRERAQRWIDYRIADHRKRIDEGAIDRDQRQIAIDELLAVRYELVGGGFDA